MSNPTKISSTTALFFIARAATAMREDLEDSLAIAEYEATEHEASEVDHETLDKIRNAAEQFTVLIKSQKLEEAVELYKTIITLEYEDDTVPEDATVH